MAGLRRTAVPPPKFPMEYNPKLFADRPFDEVAKSLSTILESIAEGYLADKRVDLFVYADEKKKPTLDDQYGAMTTFKATEKTFRAALIHVNLAEEAREQGDSETAWARLAWASHLVGRIQYSEAIETAAKKQAELTYDLKVKTIELVSALRPEGGWATHDEAYAAIEAELLEYRESIIDDKKRKEEKGKEVVDLIQLMGRWRKDDHFVRAAFAGNSAKVKAERAKVVSK